MTKKPSKAQVYMPADILRRCKADAASMAMSLSEYIATVLRERFGHVKMKPPVDP